jgi:hypothetical protein
MLSVLLRICKPNILILFILDRRSALWKIIKQILIFENARYTTQKAEYTRLDGKTVLIMRYLTFSTVICKDETDKLRTWKQKLLTHLANT